MNLLILMTTVDGEYEYTEKILTTMKEGEDMREKANEIASTFLTPNSAGRDGKRWLFEDDYREVYVEKVDPVPESDYQVLQQYLISY